MRESVRSVAALVGLIFRAAPLLAVIEFVSVCAVAVAAPLQVCGLGLLVDRLAEGTGYITGILLLAGGVAVTFGAKVTSSAVVSDLEDRVEGELHHELLKLTCEIPGIAHHEQPDLADRVAVVREEARNLKYGTTTVGDALAVVAGTVTVIVVLAGVHPLLLLLPFVGVVRVWAAIISGTATLHAQNATAQHHRRIERLTDLAVSPGHGLEIRAFNLRDFLIERFATLHNLRDRPRWQAHKKAATYDVASRLAFSLGYAAAIAFVVWQVRVGAMTPGAIALVVLLVPQVDQAASGLAGSTRMLTWAVQLVGNVRWLRAYASAHAWAESHESAPPMLHRGIRVRAVTFTYPNAATPSLTNVDLFLPAGSVVALVGDNGAGKSTLVKLLARLYDPTGGSIEVDGKDLRDLDPTAWRTATAAGFQDFVRYELLAREVIGLGDHPRLADDLAITTAVRRGDATSVIEGLPAGLDTQLGRQFSGGTDLSGGQWQRLALARAFMRPSPLLLMLDEPTAALDPEAEYTLFKRFAAASQRTTAANAGITVLVSHRFSTVRMADLIIVLSEGRVVETGTHDQLIAGRGVYHELFTMQANAYT
jgi:ATP-binding cassette, subfamily B, bacterial